MHQRRGPPRKDGPRYPCGRLRLVVDGGTDELRQKRRELVGDDRDKRASYPLGILYARGLLSAKDDQPGSASGRHYAGRRYAALSARAARAATGFVVSRCDRTPGDPPSADTIIGTADARTKFSAARRSLKRCGPHVTAVVERIVLYEQAIEASELPLLREGLAALDQLFREC
jgi:hypothetical protein